MLIIFRSRAAADVLMFGDIAYELLRRAGKEPAPQGIFTVEQIPEAVTRLRALMVESRARADEQKDEDDERGAPRVGLGQRAQPLVGMLERSAASKKPVTWERG
jgi:hypothetical protein